MASVIFQAAQVAAMVLTGGVAGIDTYRASVGGRHVQSSVKMSSPRATFCSRLPQLSHDLLQDFWGGTKLLRFESR